MRCGGMVCDGMGCDGMGWDARYDATVKYANKQGSNASVPVPARRITSSKSRMRSIAMCKLNIAKDRILETKHAPRGIFGDAYYRSYSNPRHQIQSLGC